MSHGPSHAATAAGSQLPFGSLAAPLARLDLGLGAPSQTASPLAWLRVTVQANRRQLEGI